MWGDIAIAFLLAFIVSFMLTPWSIKLANKLGAVDVPKDDRRMHKNSMPKLGGIAVIIGFLISIMYLIFVMEIEGNASIFETDNYYKKLIGIFLGIIVIAITGILDDIKTLKPLQKLFGQVLAAIIVVSFGVTIDQINIPMLSNVGLDQTLAAVATVIWIVGITNAINLMDG